MSYRHSFIPFISAVLFLSGCASGTFKERQEQREKTAASTGMFCEFISSDLFPDVDVELSLRMAKRCDSDKNFSIANHKNASDQSGIVYCCAMAARGAKRTESKPVAKPATGAPAKEAADDVIGE